VEDPGGEANSPEGFVIPNELIYELIEEGES
jgi:hypothetical protein